MPKTIDLPHGEWAIVREADEVPERLRRAHLRAQGAMLADADVTFDEDGTPTGAKMSAGAISDVGDVHDALIIAHVKEWSFANIPVNADSLGDLPGGTYDTLYKACEEQSKGVVLNAGPEGALDPVSPTVPLAG